MGSQENLEQLKHVFDAMARRDVDAIVAQYTDDYVLELPFPISRGDFRLEGRETVRRFLDTTFDRVQFTLEIDATYPSLDPNLLIAEYHGRGQNLETGKPYNNRYIGLWWFRDTLVCRTREFLDPEVVAEASTP